jgi:hypothetical protein
MTFRERSFRLEVSWAYGTEGTRRAIALPPREIPKEAGQMFGKIKKF